MRIGVMILNLLESRQMSQKEFADRLKLPVTTLNGYIKGRHNPDYTTLIKIASILEVSTDYLLNYKSLLESNESPLEIGKDEVLLITQYRKLNPEQKELAIAQIKLMNVQNNRK